jgi:hypothetical protein
MIALIYIFFVRVRNALKRSQNKEAENDIVEFQNLSYATDAMQSIVESFKLLTLPEMPSDLKSFMYTTGECVSDLVILC